LHLCKTTNIIPNNFIDKILYFYFRNKTKLLSLLGFYNWFPKPRYIMFRPKENHKQKSNATNSGSQPGKKQSSDVPSNDKSSANSFGFQNSIKVPALYLPKGGGGFSALWLKYSIQSIENISRNISAQDPEGDWMIEFDTAAYSAI